VRDSCVVFASVWLCVHACFPLLRCCVVALLRCCVVALCMHVCSHSHHMPPWTTKQGPKPAKVARVRSQGGAHGKAASKWRERQVAVLHPGPGERSDIFRAAGVCAQRGRGGHCQPVSCCLRSRIRMDAGLPAHHVRAHVPPCLPARLPRVGWQLRRQLRRQLQRCSRARR